MYPTLSLATLKSSELGYLNELNLEPQQASYFRSYPSETREPVLIQDMQQKKIK